MSPAPPRSPSYRDDRYAVFFLGGVALFAALVASALAVLAAGTVATVADRLAAPLALAGVGLLVAGSGTGGEAVHDRIVSDSRGRRLLLGVGGTALVTPAVTTVAALVGGERATPPAWESLALIAGGPIALAVCWRLLDALRGRRRGEESPH